MVLRSMVMPWNFSVQPMFFPISSKATPFETRGPRLSERATRANLDTRTAALVSQNAPSVRLVPPRVTVARNRPHYSPLRPKSRNLT